MWIFLLSSLGLGWASAELPRSGYDLVKGREWKREGQAPLTALVFLSARCPCSAGHEASLAELAGKFPEVRFIGIHSNVDEDVKEAGAHFSASKVPFPVIQDEGAKLADQWGALKTPHVFLVGANGTLYQGGVDDSQNPASAKQKFLEQALLAVREGKAPPEVRTRALGCVIRR